MKLSSAIPLVLAIFLIGFCVGCFYQSSVWEKAVVGELGVSNESQGIFNRVYGWRVVKGKGFEAHFPRKFVE